MLTSDEMLNRVFVLDTEAQPDAVASPEARPAPVELKVDPGRLKPTGLTRHVWANPARRLG